MTQRPCGVVRTLPDTPDEAGEFWTKDEEEAAEDVDEEVLVDGKL